MRENNHTFFKFMNDLIDSGVWAKLSAAARTLYPVLCRYSDETFKPVWPGTDELLRLTGFKTKKSLQQAKKELVDEGLIDFIPGSGRNPSRYYFRFDYPESRVNLDIYRDTVVSRRGVNRDTPEGVKIALEGVTGVTPNQINININQNPNEKQERLLENISQLLQKFVSTETRPEQADLKQNIISSMLTKYGQLEVGEAIKIAIERGKNGDIRYLEGILKNRQTDQRPVKNSPKNQAINQLQQLAAALPEPLQEFVEDLRFHYAYEGILYFITTANIPAKLIEQKAAEAGLAVHILQRSANISRVNFG